MRVIVCGGRDYDDRAAVYAALDKLLLKATAEPDGVLVIIQGGCKTGADKWARAFAATHHRCHLINEEADWKQHGNAAGPIRNSAMLAKHAPDGVVAMPGGSGTADCVRQAEAAGIKVWFPEGCPEHNI